MASDSDANAMSRSSSILFTISGVKMLGTTEIRQFSAARICTFSVNVLSESCQCEHQE